VRQAGHDSHAHHGEPTRNHSGARPLARLATAATAHCLIGCAIGEWIGLAIGVSIGLAPWPTMALDTALGFVGGYILGLWPLVREGMGWARAFRSIWIGETVSIAVMELAMNFTDYHLGGVQATSLLSGRFWLGYAAAVPVGFAAAWPVNYWLLKRNIKQHHHH
jgi:hypothetical protein